VQNRSPHIQEELREISQAVANLPVSIPFDLPESYFEGFPASLMARIREEMTASEELEQLSPLLAGLKQKATFEVPEGYFKSLDLSGLDKEAIVLPMFQKEQDQPLDTQSGPSSGKLVSLNRWASALKWASAAAVAGFILGALYLATLSGEQANPGPAPVAQTERSQNDDSLAVTEDALAGFLDGTASLPEEDLTLLETLQNEALANVDFSDVKFQEILQEIPDAELEAFVTEVPESTNMN
jgi:hypothetical protein